MNPIGTSMLVGENEIMTRKLMDSMMRTQEACASNIANKDVAGYHKLKVNETFETQLREMMDDGDLEAMEELEPIIEAAREEGGVSLEEEMMASNKAASHYQVLAMTYAYTASSVNLAVSDN